MVQERINPTNEEKKTETADDLDIREEIAALKEMNVDKTLVTYGSNQDYFPNLLGKNVGQVRKSLREAFNIPSDAGSLIHHIGGQSGTEVQDDYILSEGDWLEFSKDAGTKGARNVDKIVVVDVEATCWEERTPPRGEHQEIIEIGIVLLDVASLQKENKTSIFVRPTTSRISSFCTKLTTITQQDVDQGVSLKEACRRLEDEFDVRNRTWASFGDFDRNLFQKDCHYKNISYPFSTHINAKNLFAIMTGQKRELGTEEVMRLLNQPMEGTHHRAADDAWNVATILSKIIPRTK
jgi:inhibitor of KinA sporulation pathway (predicted exonuclease)